MFQSDPDNELGMAPSACEELQFFFTLLYMNLICYLKLLSTDTASAKEHGLDIITWTLERTGPGLAGWYWQSVTESVAALDPKEVEGYRLALLHVLSQDVGVLGVFSDWPATTTFYANCMGLVSEEEDEEDPVVDHLRARLERLQRQRRWQTF